MGDETKKAKILKNMLRWEIQKAMWARLKDVKGAPAVGPVKSISVPKDPNKPKGAWYTIHDQDTIQEKLLEKSVVHFSQANGTPFADKSIYGELGRHGEGGFESIDKLSYDKQSKVTVQVLEALKKARLPEIKTPVTGSEVKKRFLKWKERTSTSPSKRSMSHYHALFAPPDKDATNYAAHVGEELSEVMATRMNMCTKFGIALERWLIVHTTMLEKKPGIDRIDKLRVIHIMEADLNLLMGIIFAY